MLGLRGTKSRGANRLGFAGTGLTAISMALLLGACQVPPHQLKLASATNGIVPPPAAETPPPKSTAAPKPTPLEATPAVAHGEPITATAARLTGNPQELVGLDNSVLRRTLGQPAQIRREFTTQVWQYVTGDCVVDLYLYDQTGGLKVTYVEARSRTAEPTPTDRCLKSLLERPTASVH